MKLIFAGTPQFAVESLQALHAKFGVAAVVTQPDKPQGRKGVLTPSPVKQAALDMGISVIQPTKLKEDDSLLREAGGDILVTCAFGQILTQEILNLYPLGVWNVHASLLPQYRGAAPIARALIDGCTETGISIMRTDVGLDTGDVMLQEKCPITKQDTAQSLSEKLSSLGAEMICRAVENIVRGEVFVKRQGDGFVCKKVQRTQINFSASAEKVDCCIRGLSPAPLAYGTVNGLTLNFYFSEVVERDDDVDSGTILCADPKRGLIVKCGTNAVKILQLQPAGGKRMSARDFLNGKKLSEGMRFDKSVL